MKKFYYADGSEQKGPFTIEELKSNFISRDTKVWSEGMVNWDRAGNIEELNAIFSSMPPPIPKDMPPPFDIGRKTSKSKIKIIIASSILLILTAVFVLWTFPKWQGKKLYAHGMDIYKKTGQLDSVLFFQSASKGYSGSYFFVGKYYLDKKDTVRAQEFFNKTKNEDKEYGKWCIELDTNVKNRLLRN